MLYPSASFADNIRKTPQGEDEIAWTSENTTMQQPVTAPLQTTLAEITRIIDDGARLVCIVDDDGGLLGVVGDDEVRDAVLAGAAQAASISDIMNVCPTAIVGEEDKGKCFLQDNLLPHVVLLTAEGRPSGVVYRRDVHGDDGQTLRHAVLMVGGEGSRLRPLTENVPKPLLPIAGRPILEHIIEHLRNHGIERVTMALGYRAEQIESHFGDGSRFGVDVDYVREKKALGTAGAIGLLPEVKSDPILVMNGDILCDVDISAMTYRHKREGAIVSVAVRPYHHRIPYGVMRLVGRRVIGLEEKPLITQFSNAGIYLMDPEVRKAIPKNCYMDMTLLIEERVAQGDIVTAFPIREYWCDIGLPEDYRRANHSFPTRDNGPLA